MIVITKSNMRHIVNVAIRECDYWEEQGDIVMESVSRKELFYLLNELNYKGIDIEKEFEDVYIGNCKYGYAFINSLSFQNAIRGKSYYQLDKSLDDDILTKIDYLDNLKAALKSFSDKGICRQQNTDGDFMKNAVSLI